MTLALIAGQGDLPGLVRDAVSARGGSVIVASPAGLPGAVPFRLETIGSLIAMLLDRGATRVCFAGGVTRPMLDPDRIDAATAPLIPALTAALGQGDDGALGVLLGIFEAAGLTPVGATDLVPDLLPPSGHLAGPPLTALLLRDAARAASVMTLIGPADLGQSCVVAAGQVLAVEAVPGTAAMLSGVAHLRGLGLPLPPGGVLWKGPKPAQDRRVDLPAIGPDTVDQAVSAGLTGLCLVAGGVIVLDRARVVARATAANLCLWIAP